MSPLGQDEPETTGSPFTKSDVTGRMLCTTADTDTGAYDVVQLVSRKRGLLTLTTFQTRQAAQNVPCAQRDRVVIGLAAFEGGCTISARW
jgi:hypothetical protein